MSILKIDVNKEIVERVNLGVQGENIVEAMRRIKETLARLA